MALTVQASQNSTPSALNPDGSAAFPISVTGFGVASATATSVAPIYVNGTPNSLSLDLSGNLRVTGGGGGGAVTVADGADVAQGTTVDAAWTSGAGTVISLLKKIASAGGSAVSIADGADVAKGTTSDPAWSGSGASTIVAALKAIYAKVAGTLTTVISGSVAVTGTFFQATQPVSAASLPLPALAATSALQTTINTTLGSPMQATGGSVTANAGTNLNTSTLAKESGGNLATVATAQGASGTGITQPTGGSGLLGWLSGIYSALLSIATDVSSSIPAGSALIGSVTVDNTTPGTSNLVAISTPGRTPASTNSQAANTAIAASIPAVAGQYSYMSGLFIAGLGATAASVVACNITNILASDAGSNTWHFNVSVPAGVTVALNNGLPIIINFDPPIQSKAVDTALQVNVGAFGAGNTQAVVSVWGYTSASATF